jgi:hypothetical protein
MCRLSSSSSGYSARTIVWWPSCMHIYGERDPKPTCHSSPWTLLSGHHHSQVIVKHRSDILFRILLVMYTAEEYSHPLARPQRHGASRSDRRSVSCLFLAFPFHLGRVGIHAASKREVRKGGRRAPFKLPSLTVTPRCHPRPRPWIARPWCTLSDSHLQTTWAC